MCPIEILAVSTSLLNESFLRRKEDITGKISVHASTTGRKLSSPWGTPRDADDVLYDVISRA